MTREPIWFHSESCCEISVFCLMRASIWNGPIDQLVLGKLVDDQLAVVGRIAARRQPGDHVLALARHHRQHEDELGPRLAGQPHDHVVGRHRRAGGIAAIEAGRCARELPEILAIIEHLRRVHMVGAVELRLDQEEIFGVADMLLQVLRHGRQRLEQAREDALIGLRRSDRQGSLR